MKPPRKSRKGNNGCMSKFPSFKVLLPIPLILAAIALILQISSHQPVPDVAGFGLFNEEEFNRRSDSIPRLEVETTKSLFYQRSSMHTWHSASNDLAGQDWAWSGSEEAGPKIAFTVTTAESVPQIRVWLSYHRALGVSLFYLFVEGQANLPSAIEELRKEPGVTVIPKDDDLASKHASSHVWNETWLAAFFNKPCNHELFVTQSLNMEIGIRLATADKADWILHIDTDELIYPGGSPKYSLQEVLASVPADVDLLIFPNYESLAENVQVKDPFTEVSLFKRNYAHVTSEEYFKHYQEVQRGNPNYFTTYGNGKSAARIQPGLRPNGAHRWYNYFKTPKEWSSDQSAVLHFTYNRFSDLKSRRDRCDCAPTKTDVERCFILPFDREAFLESSLKQEDELMKWFKQRLVWEDPKVVDDLLKSGLFVRLYEPQLMVRGFREAERVRSEIEAKAMRSALEQQQQHSAEASHHSTTGQQQQHTATTTTSGIHHHNAAAGGGTTTQQHQVHSTATKGSTTTVGTATGRGGGGRGKGQGLRVGSNNAAKSHTTTGSHVQTVTSSTNASAHRDTVTIQLTDEAKERQEIAAQQLQQIQSLRQDGAETE